MKQKLKEFMEDYKGFDWKKGKLVIVSESGQPFIINDAYAAIFRSHLDDFVGRWSHDEDIMVVTLYR